MIYQTKAEFMEALQKEAKRYSLSFDEMAEDFEQHFSEGAENGESESEICEKLGDPAEIIMEYAGDGTENTQHGNNNMPHTDEAGTVAYDTGRISGGLITGVILLDLFVLDWVIPTVFALVITYVAVAFAFIVSGIANIVAVFVPFIPDSLTTILFGGIFNVFAGIAVLGLGGITAVFIPNVIKAFVGMIKAIARLHVKAFTGRKAEF